MANVFLSGVGVVGRWGVQVRGGDVVARSLAALGKEGPQAIQRGLRQWGEMVMRDSKDNYVPVDWGTLRNSGYVHQSILGGLTGTPEVVLGYGGAAAPYALSVHENPRSGKTMGYGPENERMGLKSRRALPIRARYKTWAAVGQWKYLSTPVQLHLPELRLYLAKALTQTRQAIQARQGVR